MACLSHVPFKAGEVTSLPAPMFHALGFLHATIAMILGSTLVLHRKFKPSMVLEDIEKHKVTAVVVVPVMLSRLLEGLEKMDAQAGPVELADHLPVRLGSWPADVAERALKEFGPVVYNMYGSTEIAFATIAGPRICRSTRRRSARSSKGVKVKIFDDNGKELPQGEVGRIFVGNTLPVRGLHRWRRQGDHRRAAVLRGRRLLRRARPAVRQRPRRRDDRLRRRERLPRRGRGSASAAIRRSSRPPRSASRTRSGATGCAPSWSRPRAPMSTRTPSRRYVKDNLARYKVPREVIFLDELPRNPTGKILKRELREMEVE